MTPAIHPKIAARRDRIRKDRMRLVNDGTVDQSIDACIALRDTADTRPEWALWHEMLRDMHGRHVEGVA